MPPAAITARLPAPARASPIPIPTSVAAAVAVATAAHPARLRRVAPVAPRAVVAVAVVRASTAMQAAPGAQADAAKCALPHISNRRSCRYGENEPSRRLGSALLDAVAKFRRAQHDSAQQARLLRRRQCRAVRREQEPGLPWVKPGNWPLHQARLVRQCR